MEKRTNALLLKFPGTNCEEETARALQAVGFETRIVPWAAFEEDQLSDIGLVVLSGGFSYGDYVMAGRLAQLQVEQKAGDALRRFRDAGGYLLGICNGFQILMRLGLLPEGSLISNQQEKFICEWASLKNEAHENAFMGQLPDQFELPIAHAEGRFVAPSGKADEYVAKGLVALTYLDEVNGSEARIAGLQDETGQVFGLMPHPERFLVRHQHYDKDWTGPTEWGWGYMFFKGIYERIGNGAVKELMEV